MKSATLLVKAVASAADMRGHLPILQVHLILNLSALALELMRLIVEGGGGFRTILFARCLKGAAGPQMVGEGSWGEGTAHDPREHRSSSFTLCSHICAKKKDICE